MKRSERSMVIMKVMMMLVRQVIDILTTTQATVNIVFDRVGKVDPVSRGIEIAVNYLGFEFDVGIPFLQFLFLPSSFHAFFFSFSFPFYYIVFLFHSIYALFTYFFTQFSSYQTFIKKASLHHHLHPSMQSYLHLSTYQLYSLIQPFIHPFIHTPIPSIIISSFYPFIHSSIRLCIHSQVRFWSQHISFWLVGIITITSIRGLLITLTKVPSLLM